MFCSVLPCFVLLHPVLFCSILFCHDFALCLGPSFRRTILGRRFVTTMGGSRAAAHQHPLSLMNGSPAPAHEGVVFKVAKATDNGVV